ncbi:MAG TPA: AAA domain-containing protein, partial [Ktedonobacterales bacterium]|nr:AAA domain-containing protein [Ktedonobacterales bacterium]
MGIFRRGNATQGAAAGIHDQTGKGLTSADLPMRSGLTPVAEWPDPVAMATPGMTGVLHNGKNGANGKSAAGPTSPLFAGVCRYFHDCFAADARGGVISNILDKNQGEYVTFSDGVETLITGQAYRIETPLSIGVTAQNAADVNRRDKFLIYGSIFLVGRGPGAARRKGELYCAPLLYWPAHIEQEGSQAFLTVDLEEQRINFPLLASLIDAENDEQAQAYAEVILSQAPSAPFDNAAIREFAAVVGELIPTLRTDDLQAYPELQREEAIRDLIAHDSPAQLLCASAMSLARRPTEARGVLTELQVMGQTGVMSTPLAAIFGDAARPDAHNIPGMQRSTATARLYNAPRPILAGAELSDAQTRVLRQAEQRPLTLVIGPPGTGKSFTIAQLILDAVARGQTVLLSSKMNKAVDVVVEKLQPHLGSLTVILRGGDKRYRDELKQFLDNLFDGTGAPPRPRPGEIEMLEDRLRAADAEIEQLEGDIVHILEAEAGWTRAFHELANALTPAYNEEAAATLGAQTLLAAADSLHRGGGKAPLVGWFGGRKREQQAAELATQLGVSEETLLTTDALERIGQRERLRAELAATMRDLLRYDEINSLLTRYARQRTDRGALVGELLAARRRDALAEALRTSRRTLALFKTAIEARSAAEQDKIFAELDFDALLNTFPIWAVTNPHAAELLP